MKLVTKTFRELTINELYEILRVRAEVFVVEQNCIYQDLDGIDQRSLHVFYEEEGKILSYLRIYAKSEGCVQIGRVLSTKRNAGLGYQVMESGIAVVKEKKLAAKIYIEAQVYAIGFYEKLGFSVISEEFLEDGIPHVKMMRGV